MAAYEVLRRAGFACVVDQAFPGTAPTQGASEPLLFLAGLYGATVDTPLSFTVQVDLVLSSPGTIAFDTGAAVLPPGLTLTPVTATTITLTATNVVVPARQQLFLPGSAPADPQADLAVPQDRTRRLQATLPVTIDPGTPDNATAQFNVTLVSPAPDPGAAPLPFVSSSKQFLVFQNPFYGAGEGGFRFRGGNVTATGVTISGRGDSTLPGGFPRRIVARHFWDPFINACGFELSAITGIELTAFRSYQPFTDNPARPHRIFNELEGIIYIPTGGLRATIRVPSLNPATRLQGVLLTELSGGSTNFADGGGSGGTTNTQFDVGNASLVVHGSAPLNPSVPRAATVLFGTGTATSIRNFALRLAPEPAGAFTFTPRGAGTTDVTVSSVLLEGYAENLSQYRTLPIEIPVYITPTSALGAGTSLGIRADFPAFPEEVSTYDDIVYTDATVDVLATPADPTTVQVTAAVPDSSGSVTGSKPLRVSVANVAVPGTGLYAVTVALTAGQAAAIGALPPPITMEVAVRLPETAAVVTFPQAAPIAGDPAPGGGTITSAQTDIAAALVAELNASELPRASIQGVLDSVTFTGSPGTVSLPVSGTDVAFPLGASLTGVSAISASAPGTALEVGGPDKHLNGLVTVPLPAALVSGSVPIYEEILGTLTLTGAAVGGDALAAYEFPAASNLQLTRPVGRTTALARDPQETWTAARGVVGYTYVTPTAAAPAAQEGLDLTATLTAVTLSGQLTEAYDTTHAAAEEAATLRFTPPPLFTPTFTPAPALQPLNDAGDTATVTVTLTKTQVQQFPFADDTVTLELRGPDNLNGDGGGALRVAFNGGVPVDIDDSGWTSVDVQVSTLAASVPLTAVFSVRMTGSGAATFSDGTVRVRAAAQQGTSFSYAAPSAEDTLALDTRGFFLRSFSIEGNPAVNPAAIAFAPGEKGTVVLTGDLDEQELVQFYVDRDFGGINPGGVETLDMRLTMRSVTGSGATITSDATSFDVDFDAPALSRAVTFTFTVNPGLLSFGVPFNTASPLYPVSVSAVRYAFTGADVVQMQSPPQFDVAIRGRLDVAVAPSRPSLVAEVLYTSADSTQLEVTVTTIPSSAALLKDMAGFTVQLFNAEAGGAQVASPRLDDASTLTVTDDGSGAPATYLASGGTLTVPAWRAAANLPFIAASFAAGVGTLTGAYTGQQNGASTGLAFTAPATVTIGTAAIPLFTTPGSGTTPPPGPFLPLLPFPFTLDVTAQTSVGTDRFVYLARAAPLAGEPPGRLFNPATADAVAISVASVPAGAAFTPSGTSPITVSTTQQPLRALDVSALTAAQAASVDVTFAPPNPGGTFNWTAAGQRTYAVSSVAQTLLAQFLAPAVQSTVAAPRRGGDLFGAGTPYFAPGDPQPIDVTVTVLNETAFLQDANVASLPGTMVASIVTTGRRNGVNNATPLIADGGGALTTATPSVITVTQDGGNPLLYTASGTIARLLLETALTPPTTPLDDVLLTQSGVLPAGGAIVLAPSGTGLATPIRVVYGVTTTTTATPTPAVRSTDATLALTDMVLTRDAAAGASLGGITSALVTGVVASATPASARGVSINPNSPSEVYEAASNAAPLPLPFTDGVVQLNVRDGAGTGGTLQLTAPSSLTVTPRGAGGVVIPGETALFAVGQNFTGTAAFTPMTLTQFAVSNPATFAETQTDITLTLQTSTLFDAVVDAEGVEVTLALPTGASLDAGQSVLLGGAVTDRGGGAYSVVFPAVDAAPAALTPTLRIIVDGSYTVGAPGTFQVANVLVPVSRAGLLDAAGLPLPGLGAPTAVVALASAPVDIPIIPDAALAFVRLTAPPPAVSFLAERTLQITVAVAVPQFISETGGPPPAALDFVLSIPEASSFSSGAQTRVTSTVVTGTFNAAASAYFIETSVSSVAVSTAQAQLLQYTIALAASGPAPPTLNLGPPAARTVRVSAQAPTQDAAITQMSLASARFGVRGVPGASASSTPGAQPGVDGTGNIGSVPDVLGMVQNIEVQSSSTTAVAVAAFSQQRSSQLSRTALNQHPFSLLATAPVVAPQ